MGIKRPEYVNRRAQILDLLLQHPYGMTRAEIIEITGMDGDGFAASIKRMPYIYIDRWRAKRLHQPNGGSRVKWVAVYCAADLPPNAPMPDRKPTEEDIE